jgi:hypothetical protein
MNPGKLEFFLEHEAYSDSLGIKCNQLKLSLSSLQFAESGTSLQSAKDDSGVLGTFTKFPELILYTWKILSFSTVSLGANLTIIPFCF